VPYVSIRGVPYVRFPLRRVSPWVTYPRWSVVRRKLPLNY